MGLIIIVFRKILILKNLSIEEEKILREKNVFLKRQIRYFNYHFKIFLKKKLGLGILRGLFFKIRELLFRFQKRKKTKEGTHLSPNYWQKIKEDKMPR